MHLLSEQEQQVLQDMQVMANWLVEWLLQCSQLMVKYALTSLPAAAARSAFACRVWSGQAPLTILAGIGASPEMSLPC